MRDAVRRHGALLLRILVSALLLAAVLAYADVDEVARALRDGEWQWFAAATVVMVVALVVGALRWRALLEGAGLVVTRSRASRLFAAGLALNNVLPTAIGGDAVRTWLVGRGGGRMVRAASATIVDKGTVVGCLFLLAWAALLVDSESVPASVVGVFVWTTAALAVAFVVAVLAAAGVRPVLHRLPDRVVVVVREAWATGRVWARSTRLVASLVVLGLAYEALVVLVLMLVGKTIGVELSFALAAVAASVVVVALLIPVSIGGLGVREGGFVLLLAQADIDAAQATLLSLLGVLAILLACAAVIGVTAVAEAVRGREVAARATESA